MRRISSLDYPMRSFPDAIGRFEDALKYYYWESFFDCLPWTLENLDSGLSRGSPKGILQEELLGSLGMRHVYG